MTKNLFGMMGVVTFGVLFPLLLIPVTPAAGEEVVVSNGHRPAEERSTANVEPVGGELQINSYTTSAQLFPVVAILPDSGFVVAWSSFGSAGTDSGPMSFQSVQVRRFDAAGNPSAHEVQANAYTLDQQFQPDVAAGGDGSFVVVWSSEGSSGSDHSDSSVPDLSVQGQRFAADGTPTGDEFQVNTSTTGHQNLARVAADARGDFVVVWQSRASSGSDSSGWSIQAQRYRAEGEVQGSEMQVNTITAGDQLFPRVAMGSEGEVVVIWRSELELRGRSFLSDGTPTGPDFLVGTTGDPTRPVPIPLHVDLEPTGEFVTFFTSSRVVVEEPPDFALLARRFAFDGTQLGSEIEFEIAEPERQYVSSIAPVHGTGFLVVWNGARDLGMNTDSGIRAQLFDPNGAAIGSAFQVESYGDSYQFAPMVAGQGGEFVVAWTSRGSGSPGTNPLDTDSYSIQSQHYALDPGTSCIPTAQAVCLAGGRFEVNIAWQDFAGNEGIGQVVPAAAGSDDSAIFSFFSPDNWEVLVKVLDGCSINGSFWVFAAATTNVEYSLEVVDSVTGETRTYSNPLGVASPAVTDTSAFGCN